MKTKTAQQRKTQVAVVLGPKTEALIVELTEHINATIPGIALSVADVVGGMVNEAILSWTKQQLGRDLGLRWNHFE